MQPSAVGSTAMTPAADTTALRRAANQFEAMTINELLKPMFDTVDTANGPFGGGAAEAAFRPMLVEQLAKKMQSAGGLGLADSIYHALLGAQEGKQR